MELSTMCKKLNCSRLLKVNVDGGYSYIKVGNVKQSVIQKFT